MIVAGIPFVLTCLWAGLMETFYTRPCWQLYSKSPFFCLIFVPILVALVVSLLHSEEVSVSVCVCEWVDGLMYR